MLDAAQLQSFSPLYSFNTAFRLAAFDRTLPLIAKYPELADYVQGALRKDRETADLEAQRALQQATPDSNPEAVALDRDLDRVVSGLASSLESAVLVRAESDPAAAAARELLANLLPQGLQAVVHTTFVEGVSACERIVDELAKRPEQVKAFGLGAAQDRRRTLVAKQKAALAKPSSNAVTVDQVRAAQTAGRERLLSLFFRLIGLFPGTDTESGVARRALLQPILLLNEQLEFANKRTRGAAAGQPDELKPAPIDASTPPTP